MPSGGTFCHNELRVHAEHRKKKVTSPLDVVGVAYVRLVSDHRVTSDRLRETSDGQVLGLYPAIRP